VFLNTRQTTVTTPVWAIRKEAAWSIWLESRIKTFPSWRHWLNLGKMKPTHTLFRTQQYVGVLAEHLKTHPHFKAILTSSMVDLILKSAPLHDSERVGIPYAILLKPVPRRQGAL